MRTCDEVLVFDHTRIDRKDAAERERERERERDRYRDREIEREDCIKLVYSG